MRVTLLNQVNEFNFDYATFNYGNGQMVIELTDIYIEQKDERYFNQRWSLAMV